MDSVWFRLSGLLSPFPPVVFIGSTRWTGPGQTGHLGLFLSAYPNQRASTHMSTRRATDGIIQSLYARDHLPALGLQAQDMVEDMALLRQQPRHHIPKCRALIDNSLVSFTEYGTRFTNRIPQTSRWTLPVQGIANRSVWRSSWLN